MVHIWRQRPGVAALVVGLPRSEPSRRMRFLSNSGTGECRSSVLLVVHQKESPSGLSALNLREGHGSLNETAIGSSFTATSTAPYTFMFGRVAAKRSSMWSTPWNYASPKGSRCESWRKRRNLQPSTETLLLRGVMSILTESARSAVFRDGQIVMVMESGAEIRFPAASNPRLARGTTEQLSRIELSPYGIHWPDLDEDLSFRGLLAGDHGQRQKVEPER